MKAHGTFQCDHSLKSVTGREETIVNQLADASQARSYLTTTMSSLTSSIIPVCTTQFIFREGVKVREPGSKNRTNVASVLVLISQKHQSAQRAAPPRDSFVV